MTHTDKPGDPADKAADGAFGGVTSHRAGYGSDKLARVEEWLRKYPTATLASGEGAVLLQEIDRLRAAIDRVRALHAPVSKKVGWGTLVLCAKCLDEDNDPCIHPCPTLRALDGEGA